LETLPILGKRIRRALVYEMFTASVIIPSFTVILYAPAVKVPEKPKVPSDET
jgi:hypothetical protein